jgi:hypothetical protein
MSGRIVDAETLKVIASDPFDGYGTAEALAAAQARWDELHD